MKQREFGGLRAALRGLLVALVVMGLLAVVGFLLADLNHRRYRLVVHHNQLVVERGLYLPVGFGRMPVAYDGSAAAAPAPYAPIDVPAGALPPPPTIVEESSALDRTLFELLSGWAEPRLRATDPRAVQQGIDLVRRLEILPGLSEAQRLQLRLLRAQVAYTSGMRRLAAVPDQLRQARSELLLALSLGSPRAREAQVLIDEIERRLPQWQQGLPTEAASPP